MNKDCHTTFHHHQNNNTTSMKRETTARTTATSMQNATANLCYVQCNSQPPALDIVGIPHKPQNHDDDKPHDDYDDDDDYDHTPKPQTQARPKPVTHRHSLRNGFVSRLLFRCS